MTEARTVAVDDGSGPTRRRGRVRLRTLVAIRWVAVAGQAAALLVVTHGLGFPLPIVPAMACVGASVAFNLWAGRRRGSIWLGDRDAAVTLAYDILQLGALLYLTGGLHNPFSMLILAPVTVSATLLTRRSTAFLSALAVLVATFLALLHEPLPWPSPDFRLEPIYVFALWLALVLSAFFIAAYVWSVAEEARRMSDALAATELALDREHRLAALGALAAAAAHELGTPLGTIAVAAKELARELPPESPLRADAELMVTQSERCRDILQRLARRPEAADPSPFGRRGLRLLIETAAEAHRARRPEIAFRVATAGDPAREPAPAERPALLHGIGNLLQNALQFARSQVAVEIAWDEREVTVTIRDDGPGFPSDVLDHLGEPYLSGRAEAADERQVHMGLGVFIAGTLLARTGASLAYANRPEGGAEVAIRWRRATLEAEGEEERAA